MKFLHTQFLYTLALAHCDNIEIATQDFTELHVGDTILRSAEICNGNSVKLSHLGNSIYKLVETSSQVFKVVDVTEYFRDVEPAKIRIDVERKIYGLADFVWPFLIFNVVFAVLSWVVISRVVTGLCKRYM